MTEFPTDAQLLQFSAFVRQLAGAAPASAVDILAGSITPDRASQVVDTECHLPADELTHVDPANLPDGSFLFLSPADAGRVVTVKNAAGGTGQILLASGADLVLDSPAKWLWLVRDGTAWREKMNGPPTGYAGNPQLAALAALASAANTLPYFTGPGTAALADFTAFARGLLDDADATAARATLGLGTAATLNAGTAPGNLVQLDGSGALPAVSAANLTNLPPSYMTNPQLAAIAGLVSAANLLPYFTGSGTAALAEITAFARTLLDDIDAAAARATLGLGTAATLNAGAAPGNLVQLDGSGALPGVSAANLTNVPGNYTANPQLAALAALASAADKLPYFTGSGTASLADITAFARMLLDDADAAAARATLELGTASTLNAGTAAGNLVQLDGSGALPAVSGANLTNLPNAGLPAGAVMPFAGASAPGGWLACDGTAVSRSTYASLYAVVGTTYGAGDGSTTFNLPDLRGRTVIGVGQGSGLSNRTLAQQVGAETHTLTVNEMPNHRHSGGCGPAPSGAAGGGDPDEQEANTGYSGGDQPHNNMQPSMALNYIIKT
ncbi:MAG: tail fiber protein [Magnetospirillum sp. WYHS-4]